MAKEKNLKNSQTKTLPKKGIKTFFGEIDNGQEEKEAFYAEVCHMEDRRITNAQTLLHSRLTEGERIAAWKWACYFKALIEGGDEGMNSLWSELWRDSR